MRSNKNDGQNYWSQRNDKLKRYAKMETLDPSWYTDNIYANSSIDLDDEEFTTNHKYDELNGNNNSGYFTIGDDTHDTFERQRGRHCNAEYNYPKSRSCCFGSGYDERPKPILMPKSSSFTISTTHRILNNAFSHRNTYRIDEEDDFLEPSDQNGFEIGNCYCWDNGRQRRDCTKSERDDAYHIDEMYKKPAGVDDPNENCARNSWQQRTRMNAYKMNNAMAIDELNGNYLDEFNPHNSFEEEYLIVQQNKPMPLDNYSRSNFSDELLSISRRQSQYSANVLDPIYDDENPKLLSSDDDFDQFFLDDHEPNGGASATKSKTMLEVKPPNRYDDTSSDSTDLDLDDFSFDFEKYWSELDKSTTSALAMNHRYDLDRQNNNRKTLNTNFKEKNTNVEKDKRKCKKHVYNETHFDDVDFDATNGNERYFEHFNRKRDFFTDNASTTRRPLSLCRYSTIDDQNGEFGVHTLTPSDDQPPSEFYSCLGGGNIENGIKPKEESRGNSARNNGSSNSAINLINNIFSIYKPRKYSPVNCRTSDAPHKYSSNAKTMNVPSTVRPLGVPYTEYNTSAKRPLTISSSCFGAKRMWSGPPGNVDQPYFKIIPQKTGLKISPLYRFGFEDDDYKLRLKCTARPLLFPV